MTIAELSKIVGTRLIDQAGLIWPVTGTGIDARGPYFAIEALCPPPEFLLFEAGHPACGRWKLDSYTAHAALVPTALGMGFRQAASVTYRPAPPDPPAREETWRDRPTLL